MFAALNTVEPPVMEQGAASIFEEGKSWADEHVAMIDKQIRSRLGDLSKSLGSADWLEGEFSVADILMVQVLRWLGGLGVVEEFPNLAAYVARGEAHPAFQRAYAAQRRVFEEASAT